MTDELLFDMLTSVAAVVMVTRMNLPASSIHVFAGSLLGVGMVDGIRSSNWKLVLKFVGGWILTVIFSCGRLSDLLSVCTFTRRCSSLMLMDQ
ncbi:hypothetical protein OIU77_021694 [Salix suchowensis]|uniref:Phosphate transporter n=1 Tax=Salix suchowensis TaxID=1278906 RepID=A0ABQ9CEW3_9ROSI|nr:hypothetical protein OIU77_021694 [Salix suchowensis]